MSGDGFYWYGCPAPNIDTVLANNTDTPCAYIVSNGIVSNTTVVVLILTDVPLAFDITKGLVCSVDTYYELYTYDSNLHDWQLSSSEVGAVGSIVTPFFTWSNQVVDTGLGLSYYAPTTVSLDGYELIYWNGATAGGNSEYKQIYDYVDATDGMGTMVLRAGSVKFPIPLYSGNFSDTSTLGGWHLTDNYLTNNVVFYGRESSGTYSIDNYPFMDGATYYGQWLAYRTTSTPPDEGGGDDEPQPPSGG